MAAPLRGQGISHPIIEEGFTCPGAATVASDSHSNIYSRVPPVIKDTVYTLSATSCSLWLLHYLTTIESLPSSEQTFAYSQVGDRLSASNRTTVGNPRW
ncbi:uncharacterized protein UV8b_06049 [Ustilaginoidea virens]|uniref:Uncharacterized protein n=1 Tax=Ustilaginoidea virens TaxID=1159556 RepID=A0A8E5HUK4_USTVR|nr:uncharacterized protein UV8b_06049 [Ustilaginoidea virens]QUC21808.1 hypothetical protein UV8b_06049 [Ustilaginoidea virens]